MPLVLLLALATLVVPADAAAAWRWPLRGEVITPFRLAANPFAAGQHRGIDIAAAPGAPVRSACPGRVRFAGRVPDRRTGVTVACGPLVATYLGLGRVVVRGGAAVSPGDVLGTVAASHLQLGARRAGDRNGYVDPLTLLRGESPPPLGAAPRAARRPRVDAPRRLRPPRPVAVPRTSPSPSPRPVAVPRLVPSPSRSPSPRAVAAPRFPLPAWIGLGLVAAGMPLGAFVRGRRRRRVASLPRRAAARAP